ncbi:MAG: hypothetical protein ABW137_03765 [Mycobacterium sp.]
MRDETDGSDPTDVPLSLLADLQAGLLDDETAGALRRRVRTDPGVARQLADLDRVRRELGELGRDAESAADVPASTTARVAAALRALPPPTNGPRRTR